MTLDKYPEDIEITYIVEKLNILFAAIFLLEVKIKILAYGFKQFFKGSWLNSFDCIIVIASIIDIFLANILISYADT